MKSKRHLLTATTTTLAALALGGVGTAQASRLPTSAQFRVGLASAQITWLHEATSRTSQYQYSWAAYSLSCASRNDCEAIGSVSRGNATMSFAEHWNGVRWSLQRVINPAPFSQLQSVSCYAQNRCIAVGYYSGLTVSSRGFPLIERWNGVRWRQVAIAAPKSKYLDAAFESVSCTSAGQCTATGSEEHTKLGKTTGYAMHSSGGRWSQIAAPKIDDPGEMSCPRAGDCFLVPILFGNDVGIYRQQRGTWVRQKLPLPQRVHSFSLTSLSCGSVDDCVAVGYFEKLVGVKGRNLRAQVGQLVERFDGKSWHRMLLPKALYSGIAVMNPSVSCSSANHCMVAGLIATDRPAATILENGSWHMVSGGNDEQQSLSCPEQNYCVAVAGITSTSPDNAAGLTRWGSVFNGSRWRVVKFPLPSFKFTA